ncbi:phosphoserine aminotransferase apoenzyme [Magnetococcus marinus MC-1]|uniref:Phosphoserine aminotransferase n=1 Tax=Magnetococcus marinus (strain ATCC BAA-1437 / JCM 17883 / MC-1) TaxID=156889 RepID=A0L7J0_MAGMM|nr:3-phosphoserine/phosphohydroxythreonine transaminase [Magnetococcus marinus]ABK43933.1 phosphoserine aminotransferase apoenzyme [Magnetococcus marinus MC-1]
MSRVYNFSAGPAVLPLSVLEQAQAEMLDYQGTGMSVMEMSHRSAAYMAIIAEAEALVRELMGVPTNYKVLFQQGGATGQFTMVPMNLLTDRSQKAAYVHTGSWSKKAMSEAKKQCDNVVMVASSEASNFNYIPDQGDWQPFADAAYLHVTNNNTIFGTEYHWTPESGDVPLVGDMSSNILSRPVDVSKYGIIYAGAQKNLGPSGVTLVIVREDLLGRRSNLPVMLDYKVQAESESMHNTPPTYAIYILGLVLKWVKAQGGVAGMEAQNIAKAALLYKAIDEMAFYSCPTQVESRSRMNVPFILSDDRLNESFLSEAKKADLVTLKGHRSVGGMRASLYNAMPLAGVEALVAFMGDFAKRHG